MQLAAKIVFQIFTISFKGGIEAHKIVFFKKDLNMPVSALKEKITKSPEKMDERSLNDVYFILKEVAKQHQYLNPPAEENRRQKNC